MSELKLCPFCGEEELLLLPHASRAIQTIVQCKGCLMGGPIAAWNRRASPHVEDVRREALEEAATAVEPTYGPPCDCITLHNDEWWMPRCDCRNGGDADEAQSWCTSKNEARRIRALSPPVKDTP